MRTPNVELSPVQRLALIRALVASGVVLVIGLPIAIAAQGSSGSEAASPTEATSANPTPTNAPTAKEELGERLLRVRTVGELNPRFYVFTLAFEGRLPPNQRDALQRRVDAWIARGLASEFGGLPIATASERLDFLPSDRGVNAEWFVEFDRASADEAVRALKPTLEKFLEKQSRTATLRLGQPETP